MDEDDDIWLPAVGQFGWTVIGHDHSYHKRPSELAAIKQYGIGVFYLWGATAPSWRYFQCLARAWDRIQEADANTPRPFIYHITQSGLLKPVQIP